MPLDVIYGTADAMLKAVHDAGFEEGRGPEQDTHCRYCGVWLDQCGKHAPEPHHENCLYFQVDEYLREIGRIP